MKLELLWASPDAKNFLKEHSRYHTQSSVAHQIYASLLITGMDYDLLWSLATNSKINVITEPQDEKVYLVGSALHWHKLLDEFECHKVHSNEMEELCKEIHKLLANWLPDYFAPFHCDNSCRKGRKSCTF